LALRLRAKNFNKTSGFQGFRVVSFTNRYATYF
jgi:hypothetical protein